MKKRIVVAVVLAALLEASAYAQTTDFIRLVKRGTPQSIQVAIDQGVRVNTGDKDGITPLMWAAEFNANPEVITTLLKAGADIKAQDEHGKTALMLAAEGNQNPEVITALLKAGADVKVKDHEGKTAFGYAKHNANLQGTAALKQLEEASK